MKLRRGVILFALALVIASFTGCSLFGWHEGQTYLESQLPESISSVTIDDLPVLDSATTMVDISSLTADEVLNEGFNLIDEGNSIPLAALVYTGMIGRDMESEMLFEMTIHDEVIDNDEMGELTINDMFFGTSEETETAGAVMQAFYDATSDEESDTSVLDILSDESFELAYYMDGSAFGEDFSTRRVLGNSDEGLMAKYLCYMLSETADSGEHAVKARFQANVASIQDYDDNDEFCYLSASLKIKDIDNTFDLDELQTMFAPEVRGTSRIALEDDPLYTVEDVEDIIALVWGEYTSTEDYFTFEVKMKGVDDSGNSLTRTEEVSDWDFFNFLFGSSDD